MSIFSNVAGAKTPRSKFNLSHEKKMSMAMGQLAVTFFEEVLPGDRFRVNQELMFRMAPMIAPIMHKIDVKTYYFYVPNRLVWSNWDKFITGGREGLDAPVHPYITINETNKDRFGEGSLPDLLGAPVIYPSDSVTVEERISSLPFRAYALIWSEYFINQNVQPPQEVPKTDGSDDSVIGTLTTVKQKRYVNDYFTSALPWSQRGGDVVLPTDVNYKMSKAWADTGLNIPSADGQVQTDSGNIITGASQGVVIENIDSLGTTVEDLRRSTRLQEWLERQARGGGRLTETILSHFGVKSKDQRLQRPEFLGASSNPLTVSEVLNTTGIIDDATGTASGGDVQGAMSGHGVAVGANKGFSRFFTEHGHVFGITVVEPKRNYQQGLSRKLQRFDKFDYYWPEFANIGEQEIKGKEIYFDPTDDSGNDSTFGYHPRNAEYKSALNTVHGPFRSTLNHWHLGEIFESRPQLNSQFTLVKPSKRIFAVESEDEGSALGQDLYCMVYNKVSAVRPMPYYGTPRL